MDPNGAEEVTEAPPAVAPPHRHRASKGGAFRSWAFKGGAPKARALKAGALKAGALKGGAPEGRGGRRRWLGSSLISGATLCTFALVIGASNQFANSACAAPPSAALGRTGNATVRTGNATVRTGNATLRTGHATFYGGGAGNCSYPTLPADDLYVALGPSEYSASAACGSYLDVTGAKGTVRVKVVDQCPECAVGHLDLSRTAFATIADPVAGDVPITYRAVSDPVVPGALSVRVKEGSSAGWLALLIDNHGNPLTRVAVGASVLTRTSYNYWVANGGLGAGPFAVRVTDSAGRTATITGVTLSPGRVQHSVVALSGGAAPPASVAAAPVPPASSGSGRRPAAARTTRARPAPSAAGSRSAQSALTAASPQTAASRQTAAPAAATGRNSCG